jgi:hypothetical protein
MISLLLRDIGGSLSSPWKPQWKNANDAELEVCNNNAFREITSRLGHSSIRWRDLIAILDPPKAKSKGKSATTLSQLENNQDIPGISSMCGT